MTTFFLKHAPPNPTLSYADSIILPEGTTEIVSQGGGSTIDVGKWLARKFRVKHTAIPTTAGTGSEVTKFCVLTVNGKKTTFTDDAFIPDSYILDPKLVVSLPPLHTIASGLDALSQAMESHWSVNATDESRGYSNLATNLVLENLQKCLENPEDKRARMNMLLAANLSGRAINITKTNVCHAISYPLTDWYGIPHGIACAMSLNYFSKRTLNIDLTEFLKPLIPKYKIDRRRVAEFVIHSPKLKDYPQNLTKMDIYKSMLP